MIPISSMASRIQPSATLAAGAKARQLKAQGIQVFDFSLGEPDFNTPEHICQAAVQAMRRGDTHYTPANGTPELRAAVARLYQKQYGIEYTPEQVLISNGAKHSIANVLAGTVGPGDEVVIPSPYWVSYSDLVDMTGAKAVLVQTSMESKFKMSPAQLREAITPRTKLLMLNSPCNPTGSVYTRKELEALAGVVLDSKIAVMSDEIYERLTFGEAGTEGTHHHGQRGEQEFRHDRLADRLVVRPGGGNQGDGQRAEPADQLPIKHQPGGGAGGAARRPEVRRRNAEAVRSPA
jgi:aspartate aminotransferase